ncbi:hypothetical protein [Ketogulonicigenium vulgare]|uniref:hypothetical protein n=1 Tax=Ketogulonicigenium vulgare TaxID=92945 RepID=UPI0023593777|nr:hypothetical protein [Ketogulonicigenium vulgare]
MPIYKIGTNIKIRIELDDADLAVLQPMDSVRAWARSKGEIRQMDVIVGDRDILISADTEGWPKGNWAMDVRVQTSTETVFLPHESFMTFQLIVPISGEVEQ